MPCLPSCWSRVDENGWSPCGISSHLPHCLRVALGWTLCCHGSMSRVMWAVDYWGLLSGCAPACRRDEASRWVTGGDR